MWVTDMMTWGHTWGSPVVAGDTVEGEHGQGGAGHGQLHQEPRADEQMAGPGDGEEAPQQRAQAGGQAQPELQQREMLGHHPAPLLPLVPDLTQCSDNNVKLGAIELYDTER